jgi:hypothetical protein
MSSSQAGMITKSCSDIELACRCLATPNTLAMRLAFEIVFLIKKLGGIWCEIASHPARYSLGISS